MGKVVIACIGPALMFAAAGIYPYIVTIFTTFRLFGSLFWMPEFLVSELVTDCKQKDSAKGRQIDRKAVRQSETQSDKMTDKTRNRQTD